MAEHVNAAELEYSMIMADLAAEEMQILPSPVNPRNAPRAHVSEGIDDNEGTEEKNVPEPLNDPYGNGDPIITPFVSQGGEQEDAPNGDEGGGEDEGKYEDNDDDEGGEDAKAGGGDNNNHSPIEAPQQVEKAETAGDPFEFFHELPPNLKNRRLNRAFREVLKPSEEKAFNSDKTRLISWTRLFSARFEVLNCELCEVWAQRDRSLEDFSAVEDKLREQEEAYTLLKQELEEESSGHEATTEKLRLSEASKKKFQKDFKDAKELAEGYCAKVTKLQNELSEVDKAKDDAQAKLKMDTAQLVEDSKKTPEGVVFTGGVANKALEQGQASLHVKYKEALNSIVSDQAEAVKKAVDDCITREKEVRMANFQRKRAQDVAAAEEARRKEKIEADAEAAEQQCLEKLEKRARKERRSKSCSDRPAKTSDAQGATAGRSGSTPSTSKPNIPSTRTSKAPATKRQKTTAPGPRKQ
ncbi:stress response protein NST1-like [Chenopodium quinoa]|uniref:stress response protein NST1-like n=1 Tax=Chenopodium quinoa TaxID=63459 RepID=UPI000B7785B8|nr:stress response protein NST1-like [Chenopodium quinoa]